MSRAPAAAHWTAEQGRMSAFQNRRRAPAVGLLGALLARAVPEQVKPPTPTPATTTTTTEGGAQ